MKSKKQAIGRPKAVGSKKGLQKKSVKRKKRIGRELVSEGIENYASQKTIEVAWRPKYNSRAADEEG